jgi:hypothetical protein
MKPDLRPLENIYKDIETYRRRKEKEAERLIKQIFKTGMRISCIKHSHTEGKDIRVTGIISHIGEGSEWYYARILLDPKWWDAIKQNNMAPEHEVWLALSDPNEKIEIIEA